MKLNTILHNPSLQSQILFTSLSYLHSGVPMSQHSPRATDQQRCPILQIVQLLYWKSGTLTPQHPPCLPRCPQSATTSSPAPVPSLNTTSCLTEIQPQQLKPHSPPPPSSTQVLAVVSQASFPEIHHPRCAKALLLSPPSLDAPSLITARTTNVLQCWTRANTTENHVPHPFPSPPTPGTQTKRQTATAQPSKKGPHTR